MFQPFFHPLRQALLNYSPPVGAPSSMIASVQRGQITIPAAQLYGDATITAVDLSSSLLLFLFHISNADPYHNYLLTRIELLNSTTVRAHRQYQDGSFSPTVGFSVVEFDPYFVNNIQSGYIDITSGLASNTATITGVDLGKSFVSHLGMEYDQANTFTHSSFAAVQLLNTTTVKAQRGSTAGLCRVGYSVVEAY